MAIVAQRSIALRSIGSHDKSDDVINDILEKMSPESKDVRSHCSYGRLLLSRAENALLRNEFQNAAFQLTSWMIRSNPSGLELKVARLKNTALGRVLRYKGDFAAAHSYLKECLKMVGGSARYHIMYHLADVYCELDKAEEAEKLIVDEVSRLRVDGKQSSKRFRRLALPLAEAYIRQGRLEAARSVLQELLELFKLLEGEARFDVTDQLGHVRSMIGLARVSWYINRWDEAHQNLETALSLVVKYDTFLDGNFYSVVISLFLSLVKFNIGDLGALEKFASTEDILKKQPKQHFMPGMGTYFLEQLCSSGHGFLALPRVMPGPHTNLIQGAIHRLNTRRATAKPNLDDMRGSDDMVEWLKLLGHTTGNLNHLNVIHVAGTKGKGSTCAFVASLLKAHGDDTGYPQKIGLYTSPHIKDIRERISINGEPISRDLFTSHFFEVWDRLPSKATNNLDIPRYLQLLALLSFHVFIKEKVDVAVYETHLGGEFDATNIIEMPTVTVIASIAMDHVNLLGPTIERIAWHKGGIFKSGSVALSAPQEQAVAEVLQQRADDKGVQLEIVGLDTTIPTNATALKPEPQRLNCSLALAAVRAWLARKAPERGITKHSITNGIEKFYWPGRYQQIIDRHYQWFLDGAHNDLSLRLVVEWFAKAASEYQSGTTPTRILIFSHFSTRDGTHLLRTLATSLRDNNIQMKNVIFSSYDERQDGRTRIDRNLRNRFSPELQKSYADFWRGFDRTATVLCERTIEEALHRAREIGDENNGMQALVTGSLRLISGALYLLES
ncbi:hypothetical protein EMCG_06089 [[Emmonsia] crescens]|uniref:tetrahydrofolate synthase n=1 Tax=[Emmonsia] crescens TaxID=73230 RepID=A0A0G2IC46_9EURO|nr:hypothetical protein EMCG_06089 [Emmonsia crescens UAMH 3008]